MLDLCRLIWRMFTDLFRSRATLEAEILVLRQQINVLRRGVPRKLAFNPIDRLIFIGLYRLLPQTCRALAIVKPDTVIRWHRAGFRSYWRWKSRRRCGRPTVSLENRRLIRQMNANPVGSRKSMESSQAWIEICQIRDNYRARRAPPSQGWRTFLRTMLTGSPRWTFSWFRQSRSGCSMGC